MPWSPERGAHTSPPTCSFPFCLRGLEFRLQSAAVAACVMKVLAPLRNSLASNTLIWLKERGFHRINGNPSHTGLDLSPDAKAGQHVKTKKTLRFKTCMLKAVLHVALYFKGLGCVEVGIAWVPALQLRMQTVASDWRNGEKARTSEEPCEIKWKVHLVQHPGFPW